MADIIGHPWMQGPTATKEQVKEEFTKRNELRKAAAKAEKRAQRKENQNSRARRGEEINNNVYLSGNLSQADKQDPNVICLNIKPYNPELAKTTSFFTNYVPEHVLKELTDSLSEHGIPYKISEKTWKITYTFKKEKIIEDEEEEEELKEN